MFHDAYLTDLFYKKRELITSFDEIIPPSDIEILRNSPFLAIGEIAGKDSVAAILKASERDDIMSTLPVIIYTGTLYGKWEVMLETVRYIESEVKRRYNKKVHRPVVLGSPKLWHALNGRFMKVLFEQFGFFSPCPGCHLYFHSIVIPLAKKLKSTRVIAGERESHEGKIKLNQTPVAVDAYVSLLKNFGLELVLPIRYVRENAEITSIIGKEWKDEDQMECVLSGNYKALNGSAEYRETKSIDFFNLYALPAVTRMITGILAGKNLDYQKEIDTLLRKQGKKETSK